MEKRPSIAPAELYSAPSSANALGQSVSPASSGKKPMSDVRLPSIRSLGGFDEPRRIKHSLPPPLEHSNSSSSSSSTSSALPSARSGPSHPASAPSPNRPTPARYGSETNPRVGENEQQERMQPRYTSTPHGPLISPERAALPPPLPPTSHPHRQLQRHPQHYHQQQSEPAYHPFFDAGRKEMNSRSDMSGLREQQWKTTLSQASHYLSVAHDMIGDGIVHYDGSNEASLDIVRDAQRYAGHAWQMLQGVLERHVSSSADGKPSLAASRQSFSENTHPSKPSWDEAVAQSGSSRDVASTQQGSIVDSSGRSFHVAYQAQDSEVRPSASSDFLAAAAATTSAVLASKPGHHQLSKSPAADCEATSPLPAPQSTEPQARPPVNVYRVGEPYTSASSASESRELESAVEPEAERSYMYAPASIRNRLAALHKKSPLNTGPPSRDVSPPPSLVMPSSSRPPLGVPPLVAERYGPRWSEPQSLYGASSKPGVPGYDYPSSLQHGHPHPAYDDEVQAGAGGQESMSGHSKYKKRSRAPAPSACRNCGTNETPEWRRGPGGARTLCNACGLHFAKMVKKNATASEGVSSEEQHFATGAPLAGEPRGRPEVTGHHH